MASSQCPLFLRYSKNDKTHVDSSNTTEVLHKMNIFKLNFKFKFVNIFKLKKIAQRVGELKNMSESSGTGKTLERGDKADRRAR